MISKQEYLQLRPRMAIFGYSYEVKILDDHYEIVHIHTKEGIHIKTL
tara:strand:- start:130 stop:270 length:141 start_codon:yes stop_codon:yes gene_type:complete